MSSGEEGKVSEEVKVEREGLIKEEIYIHLRRHRSGFVDLTAPVRVKREQHKLPVATRIVNVEELK